MIWNWFLLWVHEKLYKKLPYRVFIFIIPKLHSGNIFRNIVDEEMTQNFKFKENENSLKF